jgi:hypothetical protein
MDKTFGGQETMRYLLAPRYLPSLELTTSQHFPEVSPGLPPAPWAAAEPKQRDPHPSLANYTPSAVVHRPKEAWVPPFPQQGQHYCALATWLRSPLLPSAWQGRQPLFPQTESLGQGGHREVLQGSLGVGEGKRKPVLPFLIPQPLFSWVLPTTVLDFS